MELTLADRSLMDQEFWQLVDTHKITIIQLSLICNAPLKILLSWAEGEAPPDALASLKKFLGIED